MDTDCQTVTSSGTTGTPITVAIDLAGWYELNHSSYAAVARTIPGLGACTRRGGVGVALLTTKTALPAISMPLPELGFSFARRCVIGMSPEEDGRLIHSLRETPIPLLYGKPSYLLALEALQRRAPTGGSRLSPHAILVSGEPFFRDHRRRLEQWFGCRAYNAYTSAEGGLIALQCHESDWLHVRTECVRLEVLGDGGTIRTAGSGELVLTNLSNWATAFVRYRTGDHGTIQMVECACGYHGPTLTRLAGREAAFFTVAGRQIDPESLDEVFERFDVIEFQIMQLGDSFSVHLVPPTGHGAGQVERAILDDLKRRLEPAVVWCETVDAISRAGTKIRRHIVAC